MMCRGGQPLGFIEIPAYNGIGMAGPVSLRSGGYRFKMRVSRGKYWFPAKRHGWGWSLPATRQGWTALILYVALVVALAQLAPPSTTPCLFCTLLAMATLLLVPVFWLKGEPSHRRWGRK